MFDFFKRKKQVLPNFIIVGFGKCGTTSLHYALKDHPDICLVKSKEAHFFINDEEYAKGLGYYFSKHFEHYSDEKAIGDITPAYVYVKESLTRIRESLGEGVKIIVIMRHPVVRAFSHYIHSVRISEERESFLDSNGDIKNFLYKSVSMYSQSLRNLYATFSKENILPLIFERDILKQGTHIACEKIESFIKVPHWESRLMKTESAKGYLASITILDKAAYIEKNNEKIVVDEGDVVIEHVRKPIGYYFEKKSNVSPEEMEWYKSYPDNITLNINNELVKDLYSRLYKKDVEEVQELTGLDLSIWDDVTDVGDYEIIKSRLKYD